MQTVALSVSITPARISIVFADALLSESSCVGLDVGNGVGVALLVGFPVGLDDGFVVGFRVGGSENVGSALGANVGARVKVVTLRELVSTLTVTDTALFTLVSKELLDSSSESADESSAAVETPLSELAGAVTVNDTDHVYVVVSSRRRRRRDVVLLYAIVKPFK